MNARHRGVAKLWLLNLFGNAALLAAVYLGLTIPDAHVWQVACSTVLALAVIFFGLWLRTGSFAFFRVGQFRDTGAVWLAFRHAMRHMVALAIWAIPLAVVGWLLFSCLTYVPQFGVWFWQKAPFLRVGSPKFVSHVALWVICIIMAFLATLWLPPASTVAAVGFWASRIGRSWRLLRRASYWIWLVLLVLAGGYVPYKLVWWIPQITSLAGQAWSAGLRLALAYVLVVSAWVALLLVIGDRLSQLDPLTVVPVKPSIPPKRARHYFNPQ